MDILKKYKSWEIVVAILPLLFAIDGFMDSHIYPYSIHWVVNHVIAFAYIAILIYSIYCMYRGAKQTERFPKLMLVLLIAVTVVKLFGFVNRFLPQGPTEDFQVPIHHYILGVLTLCYTVVMIIAIVRMFMSRINVLAITCTCAVVVIPLLEELMFFLFQFIIDENPTFDLGIIFFIFSFLISLCYSVLFLHRNDFYNLPTDSHQVRKSKN